MSQPDFENLVDRLRVISIETLELLREARSADGGDPYLALKAVERLERQIQLEAMLVTGTKQRSTISIELSTEWTELRSEILAALERHPEARSAVVEVLTHAEK